MNTMNLSHVPTSGGVQRKDVAALWAAATAVAGLGAWVMYDALPGVNWPVWVGVATAGLIWFVRRHRRVGSSVMITGATAVVISGAAVITATPLMLVLICGTVMVCLAMQMLLSANPAWVRLSPRFAVTAPFLAFGTALVHSVRHAVEATFLLRSPRAGAGLRGLAITVPVVLVFGLLFAGADPVFAGWRDAVERLFSRWSILPRAVFFVGLLGIVLGAYGYASRENEEVTETNPKDAKQWLGSTERLMLLAGVGALFWLFLALQISYLFGNLPRIVGSGMTFAEHARRGFAELTIVGSATAVLIILSERFGQRDGRAKIVRVATFGVLAPVFFLLASAFNRVLLYERAYGFTSSRLYGQIYMVAVAMILVALCLEVAGELDVGRLFRRGAAVTAALFICLVYWNHEAWIAHRNLDQFAMTGKLDIAYLAGGLSMSAVPAIGERLPSIPEPARSQLRTAIQTQYRGRSRWLDQEWYEWNLRRARARSSLASDFGLSSSDLSGGGVPR